MTDSKEKRARPRPRPRPEKHIPTCPARWAWFFGGILLGIFISFIVYLRTIVPTEQNTPSVASNQQPTSLESKESNASSPTNGDENTPRFEFYETLPETEIEVSPPMAEEGNPNNFYSQPPQNTPNGESANFSPLNIENGQYVLQVGAFRDIQTAQGLQNHLVAIGFNAYIESATLKGLQWYRVRVGPFQALTQVNRVRAQLMANNIEADVLKEER